MPKEDVSIQVGGVARTLSPEQQAALFEQYGSGTATGPVLSEENAQELTQAEADKHLAESKGQAMAGLAGLASGVSFGFAPALHIALQGMNSPEAAQEARHIWAGQKQMTGYGVGQAVGILGGTKGIGTLGKAVGLEARLSALLPEAEGILGSTVRGGVSLGTRGAAEGALMGLGTSVEEAAIQNKPLAAEAVLARMETGAILGGGLGGAIGATGGLVKGVAPKISSVLGSALKRVPGASESHLLRELGASGSTVRRIGEEVEGGTSQFLKDADQMASKEGLSLSSEPTKLRDVARQNLEQFSKLETNTAKEFDKVAPMRAPSWGGFAQRVHEEIIAPEMLMPGGTDRAARLSSWIDKMAPPQSSGFSGWVRGREAVLEASKALGEGGKKVLAMYDTETRTAMESAEAMDPALKGATGRYTSALTGKRVASELESLMEERAAAPPRSAVTSGDLGAIAGFAAGGHVMGGVKYALGRAGFRALSERMGPQIAEAMWKMSAGANAANAVGQMKGTIEKAVNAYLTGRNYAAIAVGKEAAARTKITRQGYDAEVQDTYNRISEDQNKRLQRYIQASGSLALAQTMLQKSDTAIGNTQKNIPPAKGNAGTLRPLPKSTSLDFDEHIFLLRHGPTKNPYSIFSAMSGGKLSKESVDSLKQNWPETYHLMEEQFQNQIAKLAEKGKTLPVEKITQLSILLDKPLDGIVEKEWIQEVQTSFQPEQAPQAPQPMAPPQPTALYETPTEKLG